MRRRGRLPQGARLSTFLGLSVRTLRARPLRSGLTAGAIVLGVGMVFGVLLLVGTIHSTFSRLYDSIYGRTDIVISGKQAAGALAADSIESIRVVKGVESASGTIFSFFRTVDARGKVQRSAGAQLYVVGADYAQPDTTDSEQVAGRNPRAGAGEIEVDRGWADKRGLGIGDTIRLSTPAGLAALRISGLYELGAGFDLGDYGTGSIPVQDARPLMDKPATWDEIAVVVAPAERCGRGIGTGTCEISSWLGRVIGPGSDTRPTRTGTGSRSIAWI